MARIVTIRVAGTPRRIAVTPQLAMMAQGMAERGDFLPPAPDGDYEYWLPWLVLWIGDRERDRKQPFDEWLLDADFDLADSDAPDVVTAVKEASSAMPGMAEQAPPDPTRADPSSG